MKQISNLFLPFSFGFWADQFIVLRTLNISNLALRSNNSAKLAILLDSTQADNPALQPLQNQSVLMK